MNLAACEDNFELWSVAENIDVSVILNLRWSVRIYQNMRFRRDFNNFWIYFTKIFIFHHENKLTKQTIFTIWTWRIFFKLNLEPICRFQRSVTSTKPQKMYPMQIRLKLRQHLPAKALLHWFQWKFAACRCCPFHTHLRSCWTLLPPCRVAGFQRSGPRFLNGIESFWWKVLLFLWYECCRGADFFVFWLNLCKRERDFRFSVRMREFWGQKNGAEMWGFEARCQIFWTHFWKFPCN